MKKKKKEQLIKVETEKPRLEIIKYQDFDATKNNKNLNNDCNVLVLKITNFIDCGRARFFYNEKALKDDNLIFVEYE